MSYNHILISKISWRNETWQAEKEQAFLDDTDFLKRKERKSVVLLDVPHKDGMTNRSVLWCLRPSHTNNILVIITI